MPAVLSLLTNTYMRQVEVAREILNYVFPTFQRFQKNLVTNKAWNNKKWNQFGQSFDFMNIPSSYPLCTPSGFDEWRQLRLLVTWATRLLSQEMLQWCRVNGSTAHELLGTHPLTPTRGRRGRKYRFHVFGMTRPGSVLNPLYHFAGNDIWMEKYNVVIFEGKNAAWQRFETAPLRKWRHAFHSYSASTRFRILACTWFILDARKSIFVDSPWTSITFSGSHIRMSCMMPFASAWALKDMYCTCILISTTCSNTKMRNQAENCLSSTAALEETRPWHYHPRHAHCLSFTTSDYTCLHLIECIQPEL